VIARWRKAIRIHPDDAPTYFSLGVALGQGGDIDGQIAAYREAIRLKPHDPEYADAYHLLGQALAQKGAWREAIDVYVALIRIQPDDEGGQLRLSEAHRHLGLAHLDKRELGKAIEEFGLTLQLNPSDQEATRALQSALLFMKTQPR